MERRGGLVIGFWKGSSGGEKLCLRLLLVAFILRAAGGRRAALLVGNEEHRELAATRPIILLGLPLSGHHIIHDALMQAKVRSSHNDMNRHAATLCNRWPVPEATVGDRIIGNKTWPQIPMTPECFVGISIQRAIAENRPPLDELLHLGYRAFSQLDSCHGSLCTFPQYEALTQIAAAYPDAYFVYTKKHTVDSHTNALVAHAEWDDLLRRYEKAGYLGQFPGQSKDKSARDNAVIMLSAMQDRISGFFRGPVTGAGVGAGAGTASGGRSLKDEGGSSGAKSPGAKGANPFGPSKIDFGSAADIAAAASASVSGTGGSAPAAHPTSSDTAKEKKQQENHQKEQLKEARKQQHKQKQAERAEEIERERIEEKERLKKESEAAKAIAANVTAAHKVDKQTKAEAKANATAIYKAATSTNTKFNYLEIDVEDPGAAAALETFLGVRGLVLRLSREFVKDVASVAPAASKGQTMKAQSEGQGNKAVNATMAMALNRTSRATSTKMPSRTGTETAAGENKASGFSRDMSEFPGPGSTPTANQPKELVVLVGLPKSGTSSVNDALRRLKVKTAHFEVNEFRADKICTEWPIAETRVGGGSSGIPETFWGKANKPDGCYVGHVMQRALTRGKKPLADLISHGYRAFTQIDLCRGNSCFFPQAEALDELTTAYPKALFVHTRRANLATHVASMDAWDGMLARFQKGGYLSKFAGQSANNSMAANGAIMVQELTRRTLDFFAKRPQLRFIDLSIEDQGSASKLAKFLGVPEQAFALDKTNTGHYDKKHSAAPTSVRVSTQSQRRARAESE